MGYLATAGKPHGEPSSRHEGWALRARLRERHPMHARWLNSDVALIVRQCQDLPGRCKPLVNKYAGRSGAGRGQQKGEAEVSHVTLHVWDVEFFSRLSLPMITLGSRESTGYASLMAMFQLGPWVRCCRRRRCQSTHNRFVRNCHLRREVDSESILGP